VARVIVAEDDFLLGLLYQDALEAWGHETFFASNGKLALAAVALFDPHLVVTDLAMPELTGAELARAIRNDPAHSEIPIILMTAYSRVLADSDAALFDAILRKPVPDQTFVTWAIKMLHDAERRASDEHGQTRC